MEAKLDFVGMRKRKELLSVEEAMDIMKVSAGHVQKLAAQKHLKATTLRRRLWISADSINEYMRSGVKYGVNGNAFGCGLMPGGMERERGGQVGDIKQDTG